MLRGVWLAFAKVWVEFGEIKHRKVKVVGWVEGYCQSEKGVFFGWLTTNLENIG